MDIKKEIVEFQLLDIYNKKMHIIDILNHIENLYYHKYSNILYKKDINMLKEREIRRLKDILKNLKNREKIFKFELKKIKRRMKYDES